MNSSLKAYLADQQSLALSLQYCATAVENLLDAGLGESLAASEAAAQVIKMARDLQIALDSDSLAKVSRQPSLVRGEV
ncbi:hypothetical protein [Paracoccus denitrificans]|jgi:hypothetical protein|uniref:hypothetical protein n=1 Tax=Paracoccus denitrificans TaxID=266 RepID=UPI00059FF170|nr:hypothetical protein [Paracoccus denitrificans]MBB4628900.1 hypothetical protein [Paracoccus denitrificans]MCU7429977.1 hypothetical protein [Paracoccus denitrificans]QAR26054.1 hypothetical protein EO213_06920 [Paracoccus denitrificans]UPV94968.1 hypothetical protein M0K93_14215 [Paracoccus denitrificans]WQO32978.1 hypothetical protein U0005_11705 [Paracoccus denitrificans]